MKTIKLSTVLLALFAMSLLTGCIDEIFIDGNGISESEGRITRNFTGVNSNGDFIVHISHGNQYDVVVKAESNLLPFIETNVRGNQLYIGTSGIRTLVHHLPIEVDITTPVLEELVLSGSGLISTDNFVSENMEITISGSGKIETSLDTHNVRSTVSGSGQLRVSGITDLAGFAISGSGRINGSNLEIGNCEANISGSGEMFINVEKYLIVKISGSGNVFYKGKPDIETHISGSGRLIFNN
jgi:hypothetical protein